MEIPLTLASINAHIPNLQGCFCLLQSVPYPRYRGETRILMLGESTYKGLRVTLKNLLRPSLTPPGLRTLLNHDELLVTVMWEVCEQDSFMRFLSLEAQFLRTHLEGPFVQPRCMTGFEFDHLLFPEMFRRIPGRLVLH